MIAIDNGDAFLNVHMRLDRVMTSMLTNLDPSYSKYCDVNNTVVVRLDNYGCVEASLLWCKDLESKLTTYGFVENPYGLFVFNKIGKSGKQIILPVDDLMVTSECQDDLDAF